MRLARFAAVVTTACAASPAPPVEPASAPALPPTTTIHPAASRSPFPCPSRPQPIAQVLEPSLDELSGIVESHGQPGVFFVHNDSGDSPRFFAIDLEGRLLAIFTLPSVPLLLDAEDIAVGPGPGGQRYVYLGDTGNNFASMGLGIPRRKAVLYRIPEPNVRPGPRSREVPLEDVTPIVFTFPEGARDVEAFVIDPIAGDALLISRQRDGRSQLLTATAAQLAQGGGELQLAGRLVFGKPPLDGSPMPTSADISADGSRVVVRTYSSVFAFDRRSDESLVSALSRPPRHLASPDEGQGEAIALTDAGRAFVTIAEGRRPRIWCGAWQN